ncbi:MAG: hypothetical protein QGD90_01020 [Candidatus Hydrogenedentes bacterium]|nr:hypothetical protein [Candidatus Hydrogenedentota bacterium]
MTVYVVHGWAADDDVNELGVNGVFSERADAESHAARLNEPMSYTVYYVLGCVVDAKRADSGKDGK